MTMNNISKKFLMTAAIICFTAVAWELSFSTAISAQETQRNRQVAASPIPKTTPTPKTTPSVAPTVNPSSSPTPAATPSAQLQTLPELQSKIRAILQRPQLMRGSIGVKAVSLDSGKVMFEDNAEKYFMPASNMKNFTVSTALSKLSPNYRFITTVYAPAKPDANGLIKGDLTIYGRGDPSIAAAFNDGDYYKGMENLANKIVEAGVKKVEGNLVGDESYFTSDPIPIGWEWDDLQWYYGAEVSALTVNDNSLDVNVKPGASVGAFANTTLAPMIPGIVLKNYVVTAPAKTQKEAGINKPLAQNVYEVTGKIAINDPGSVANFGSVAVSRPSQYFIALLRQILEQKGVTITGQSRVVGVKEKAVQAVASSLPWIEITRLESAPLGLIAAKTLKPSQNLYTELILRTMGESIGDRGDKTGTKKDSLQLGVGVVDKFLKEAGVPDGSVMMYDGSGLSRHNLITPNALIQIHTYMSKGQYAQIWCDSLPIGGVDGTLKTRLKEAATANNVRAKTGTIDQVSSLSGYVTTAGGEKLVFAVIINGVMSQNFRQDTIDDIVRLLASYNGRSN